MASLKLQIDPGFRSGFSTPHWLRLWADEAAAFYEVLKAK